MEHMTNPYHVVDLAPERRFMAAFQGFKAELSIYPLACPHHTCRRIRKCCTPGAVLDFNKPGETWNLLALTRTERYVIRSNT